MFDLWSVWKKLTDLEDGIYLICLWEMNEPSFKGRLFIFYPYIEQTIFLEQNIQQKTIAMQKFIDAQLNMCTSIYIVIFIKTKN